MRSRVKPVTNKKEEGTSVEAYNGFRLLSFLIYFENRLHGLKIGEASEKIAKTLWPQNSKPSRARSIVKWSKEYLEYGDLSDHCQGLHVKRQSFLSHNDIKSKVLEYMKKTNPAERTLFSIKTFIEEEVIPSCLGVSGSVSITTLSKYLKEWGYSYGNKKGLFFDGHERQDVVEYRKAWCQRMMKYMAKSEFYSGEQEEQVLEPNLDEGEEKVVFVTHDKSTFYTNDGKDEVWTHEDESVIRKKGPGSSIMVSEFQCPCHGTMRIRGWTSRKLFKAGESRDGWWTSKDMVAQLKDHVIGLFESLHPDCRAVFLFDNSSNHGAYSDDALVASRMTLNEKAWPLTEKYQFKDTTIELSTGQLLHQSFYYDKEIFCHDSKGRVKKKNVRYFKGK